MSYRVLTNRYPGIANDRVTAVLQVGNVFIDALHWVVKVQGRQINLRPREFSLLFYFMQNPDIVLSSGQICERAWGITAGYEHGVSHPIYLLRQSIEPDPKNPIYIHTVYQVGYRFTPQYN